MPIGTPWMVPRRFPALISASACLACSRASSASTVMKAFRCGVSRAICARQLSTASTEESVRSEFINVNPDIFRSPGGNMRVIGWIAAALALSLAKPVLAQEDWDNFKFPEDGFEVNFPGKPKIENTTWVSQYRYNLPAKVFSATRGKEQYKVTVVDYRPVLKLGEERAKTCPAGAETCIGTQDGKRGGIIGLGYSKMDIRGAMTYAALKMIQRPGVKTTDMNLQFEQVVEGLFMQLTNPDESRTFGYITMHENRLYVFEGTVPKGIPEPGLFQGSVGFVDAKGGSIRYTDYY